MSKSPEQVGIGQHNAERFADLFGGPRDMTGQLTTADSVLRFITGGNAYVTIRSRKTSTRYTYRVSVAPGAVERGQDPLPYFIALLNGDNNEDSYTFFGTMFVDAETKFIQEYRHGRRTRISDKAPAVRAIHWVLGNLRRGGTTLENPSNFLHQLEVWHDGRCGRCGRKLTVPESVASGFGPECIQHMR